MKRYLLPLIAALALPTAVSADSKGRQLEFSKRLRAFEILAIAQCHENAGNMNRKEANLFAINELRNEKIFIYQRYISIDNPKKYLSNGKVKRAAKKLSTVYQEKNVNCYSKAERDKAEKDKGGRFSNLIFDILM